MPFPPINLILFHDAAQEFAATLSGLALPDLYGATDGKAVGTKVEAMFKAHLSQRFDLTLGNAARGIDFPGLNLDLKVTSLRQPQSSSPFENATQKIYGLGYHLLVIVYLKHDDAKLKAAFLDIRHVIFVDARRTGDFTITRQIREAASRLDLADAGDREVAAEEIDAILQDKNVPLDEVSRRSLAERVVHEIPEQGVLTISNALQWRLQYGRAISAADKGTYGLEVRDLLA